jgi:hypothetical protein
VSIAAVATLTTAVDVVTGPETEETTAEVVASATLVKVVAIALEVGSAEV